MVAMGKKMRRPDVLRIIALFSYLMLIVYAWVFVFIPKTLPPYLTVLMPDRSFNVLIMGVDYDYDEHSHKLARGRADTLILARIDPFGKRIDLLSIPRDLLVEVPGRGWHKVNASYGMGGADLAMRTVSKMLGVKVDHYMIVDLDGLISLVDSLGGIRIYVEKDMHHVDIPAGLNINLKKGKQKLSGRQAEGYVRYRGDAMADIGRIDRQKNFVKALSSRLASPAALVRMPFCLKVLKDSVRSDMSFWQMIKTANLARTVAAGDIGEHTVPGDFGQGEFYGYWIMDEKKMRDLKQSLRL